MHPESPKEAINPQILAEACEWLVELETGDASSLEARRNFDAWLRQSPEHIRAYLEILPIWKQGSGTRFAHDAGPEALIAYARMEDNVVPLGVESKGAHSDARPPRPRPEVGSTKSSAFRHRFALAAAVSLVLLGAMLTWLTLSDGATYTTSIGEQHSVILPDGSTLELNARSKVKTRFSDRQRTIDLIQGQALFRVAKDHARPFIVNAGGTRVLAVGTQFDVNRKIAGTVVTVLEGRVAVLSPNLVPARSAPIHVESEKMNADEHTGSLRKRTDGRAPVYLSAGEQVTVPVSLEEASRQPMRANMAAATAWTRRQLVFDASSLAEVVEEFNRYNTRPLVILDPSLDDFPISGSFSSANPASLIRFLEAQPGIQVVATDDETRISVRR